MKSQLQHSPLHAVICATIVKLAADNDHQCYSIVQLEAKHAWPRRACLDFCIEMYRVLCFLLEIRLTKQSASKQCVTRKSSGASLQQTIVGMESILADVLNMFKLSSWHKLLEISRFEAGFHPSAHFGVFFM